MTVHQTAYSEGNPAMRWCTVHIDQLSINQFVPVAGIVGQGPEFINGYFSGVGGHGSTRETIVDMIPVLSVTRRIGSRYAGGRQCGSEYRPLGAPARSCADRLPIRLRLVQLRTSK